MSTKHRTIRDDPESDIEERGNVRTVEMSPNDPLGLLGKVVRTHKLLRGDDQIELARRVNEEGDMDARDALVLHNIRLALWIARKYPEASVDFIDKIHEGIIGLITAVDKFDHTMGNQFSTYAQWWVRQALSRFLQDHRSMIREPVHLQKLRYRVQRASAELAAEIQRIPTPAEIAARLNIEEKMVVRSLKRLRIPVVSLEDTAFAGTSSMLEERTIGDSIPDENQLDPLQMLEAKEELRMACEEITTLVDTLYDREEITDRNKAMFTYYYGLDNELQGRTLEVTGEKFNITREAVRQIVVRLWLRLNEDAGVDMDHDRLVRTIERIRLLETLTHESVGTA